MRIRLNTNQLCQIAGIKHGRFNWLISHNTFPWVPVCHNKHSRSWDRDDVLTVLIYQELVNNRATIHRAATIANAVGAAARAQPECALVAFVEDADGARAIAFDNLRDVNFDAPFRQLEVFAIAPRRHSIEQEIASLQVSEAA